MRLLLFLSGGLAVFLVGNWVMHQRAKTLARSRSGMGFADFAAHISAGNLPHDKLRVVYEHFQGWQTNKNFPVLATDDLYKVYGICDDDLDDAVIDLAAKWRVVLPNKFEGMAPVRTVADVVHLLARLPYGRNNTPV